MLRQLRLATARGLIAGMAMSALLAVPVVADSFAVGPPDSGYLADSSIHTYCFTGSFDVNLRDNADYAMEMSIAADTDMFELFEACLSTTDIWWWDRDLPGTTRGFYDCVVFVTPGVKCNEADIVLDPAQINIGAFDEEDTSKTACHEAGHSVGLTHGGTTDCMLNGQVPDAGVQYRRFSSHHKGHINTAY